MKLYHGTTSVYLEPILKTGIQPRGKAVASNWDGVTTRTDLVYLSICHGPSIAYDVSKAKGGIGLILEVNVRMKEFNLLLPDEDLKTYDETIAANTRKPTHEINLIIENYRKNLERNRADWQRSLNTIGSVAFRRRIESQNITRYCLVDFDLRQSLSKHWIEDQNKIEWGIFIGKGLTKWLFGDQSELPKLQHGEYEELRLIESKDRAGVTVICSPFS